MTYLDVFLIKKLGWENAAELSKSSKNILDDYKKWIKQVIVVSAMRSSEFNTTDILIKIWILLSAKKIDKKNIVNLIKQLEDFHLDILSKKLLLINKDIIKLIKDEFDSFKWSIEIYINTSEKTLIPNSWNDYSINIDWDKILPIIWYWETISCKIFAKVLESIWGNWIISKSIDLSNLVDIWELNWITENEIFVKLSSKIAKVIEKNIKKWIIPVLSWYIWIFENWIENTIWRGYSDATAAITSIWLAKTNNNVVLEIQKSVKWLLSWDPKILENPKNAKLIKKLNYLTAREITWDNWAQAKLLHYQTLRSEVQEAWIKIHLYDPFSNDSDWSRIDDNVVNCDINSGVEFIWWRNNIIFFSISSGKMFEKGILTRLFSIVDDYFSVDIVSTSETEVTFTIDWKYSTDKKLEDMTKKIKKEFSMTKNTFMEFVEYKKNKSLVFCVGQHMRDRVWLMSKATKALSDNWVNIEMISQWRLQRSIIFWIDETNMKKAVNVLHNTFITK